MITIVDEFFSNEECDFLIKFHSDNMDLAFPFSSHVGNSVARATISPKHLEIDSLQIEDEKESPNLDESDRLDYLSIIKKIESKTQECYGSDIVHDWSKLKKSEIGGFSLPHYDESSQETILAAIVYLNDNFRGGETYFGDGTIIPPKPGRILMFDGLTYLHGATPNIGGYRYSIAMWFKKT